jgi:hypothetical protein
MPYRIEESLPVRTDEHHAFIFDYWQVEAVLGLAANWLLATS